ncbi:MULTISPECIES: hypothetical protein [unclassified Kaistella]|uniref:lectin-like domain-containing protein n=1 Tax=unclassified Kaistella TaxID=2762626 RepID=UPI0027361639|nr:MULTISPECIES: hypothetical protein [unclassified Kaistella]MDP2453673.1 hypothetical protein [Kaistella sp. SH11-4b]MDP2456730.1 hypothetical protein [Kaistella sp. SH40-3]MDP2459486.1 hypothetical protein [Kaistella sp. SH19-2b]
MNYRKQILFAFLFVIGLQNTKAQFTITNTFATNDATGLKIGDNAYLTAAAGADPNGQGYLRLTEAKTNQKGYLYVQQSFPTSLGVIADFEYKTWRNIADTTYDGADGFSVFLFDGATTEANFKLGGYGGSLGYSPNSGTTPTGLSGGYIGIGFDEYGNFSNPSEGRVGGPGYSPNAVVLRGPTTATAGTTNPFLKSINLGDRTGGDAAIRKRDEIDYNTTTATRPTNSVFYRRVQVEISKSGADYLVTIRWRKQGQTLFTNIISYTMSGTTYPLPTSLKLGFAASTGGGFNLHEIRNLILTTPGFIRVDSRANTSFVCKEKKTQVVFNMEVTNDTAAALTKIDFKNRIVDENEAVLTNSQFTITGITTTGFINSTLPGTSVTNQFSGEVGLAKNSSGIVTVTGFYNSKGLKTNKKLFSKSSVSTTEITDTDLTNNVAQSEVVARKCSVISNPMLPSYTK